MASDFSVTLTHISGFLSVVRSIIAVFKLFLFSEAHPKNALITPPPHLEMILQLFSITRTQPNTIHCSICCGSITLLHICFTISHVSHLHTHVCIHTYVRYRYAYISVSNAIYNLQASLYYRE
jgi:S-adenosylmethionine/arginine decarboxylase-like enzyme